MKYYVVEVGSGAFRFRVVNEEGKYAAVAYADGRAGIRKWTSEYLAQNYIDKHMGPDCIWVWSERGEDVSKPPAEPALSGADLANFRAAKAINALQMVVFLHQAGRDQAALRTAANAVAADERLTASNEGLDANRFGYTQEPKRQVPLTELGERLRRMVEQQSRYDPAEHMRQRWQEQRERMTASQPLFWPVIPQADDFSNEEACTIPTVIINGAAFAATTRRRFINSKDL